MFSMKIRKLKAVELFENGSLDKMEAGSFRSFAEIHKVLSGDIHDFARKVRIVSYFSEMEIILLYWTFVYSDPRILCKK